MNKYFKKIFHICLILVLIFWTGVVFNNGKLPKITVYKVDFEVEVNLSEIDSLFELSLYTITTNLHVYKCHFSICKKIRYIHYVTTHSVKKEDIDRIKKEQRDELDPLYVRSKTFFDKVNAGHEGYERGGK